MKDKIGTKITLKDFNKGVVTIPVDENLDNPKSTNETITGTSSTTNG